MQPSFCMNNKYIRTLRNKRLFGSTFLTLKTQNEIYCVWECSRNKDCGSVNYQKIQKLCELNRYIGIEDNSLNDNKGWIYYEKDKYKEVSKQGYPCIS